MFERSNWPPCPPFEGRFPFFVCFFCCSFGDLRFLVQSLQTTARASLQQSVLRNRWVWSSWRVAKTASRPPLFALTSLTPECSMDVKQSRLSSQGPRLLSLEPAGVRLAPDFEVNAPAAAHAPMLSTPRQSSPRGRSILVKASLCPAVALVRFHCPRGAQSRSPQNSTSVLHMDGEAAHGIQCDLIDWRQRLPPSSQICSF